jgi:hypothetical protein
MSTARQHLTRRSDPVVDEPRAFRDRLERFWQIPLTRVRDLSGTILDRRYLVGELLSATEWDVLYAGYDLDSHAKVVIRL